MKDLTQCGISKYGLSKKKIHIISGNISSEEYDPDKYLMNYSPVLLGSKHDREEAKRYLTEKDNTKTCIRYCARCGKKFRVKPWEFSIDREFCQDCLNQVSSEITISLPIDRNLSIDSNVPYRFKQEADKDTQRIMDLINRSY